MANYKAMKEALNSNSGGKYFKPVDGENKIRIVSEPVPTWKSFDKVAKTATVYLTHDHAKLDQDARPRFQMYLINRNEGNKLQLAEFGPQIMDQFCDMAISSEYGFDSIPPYDMILIKVGSGMETEYKLQASRKNTDLTAEEQKQISEVDAVIDLLLADNSVVDKDAYRAMLETTRLDEEYRQMTKS